MERVTAGIPEISVYAKWRKKRMGRGESATYMVSHQKLTRIQSQAHEQ